METETKNNLKFPKNFLWGASTSAHQVEGNTKNNWSKWEKENAQRLAKEAKGKWQDWQQEKFPEMFDVENYISGQACDHYNRYEEDFDFAKNGGHNAHRFSIEWSRIEPEEGKFDEKEIKHYQEVIRALRERGLEPFVCLWHWTHPIWLENKGGCASDEFIFYFERYVDRMSKAFDSDVKFWITINEPTSVIFNAYAIGQWPPCKINIFKVLKVYKVLADSHKASYDIIHRNVSGSQVGFANILGFFESNKNNFLNNLLIKLADYFSNKKFLKMTGNKNDFLAIQYYFHRKLSAWGNNKNENKIITDMDWEVYPEGVYHLIKDFSKYNLPIYITENGLADANDEKRAEFIKDHLFWIHKAILEGVDVRGYFYWSLLDNFEWDKGFWPRFGLIEIDYKTLERKPRKSFYEYKNIIENSKN